MVKIGLKNPLQSIFCYEEVFKAYFYNYACQKWVDTQLINWSIKTFLLDWTRSAVFIALKKPFVVGTPYWTIVRRIE